MPRILILHNRYRYAGGEDQVVAQEETLLREAGLPVALLEADNRHALEAGRLATALALWGSTGSRRSYRQVRQAIDKFSPDVAHIHNLWFTLGLSAIRACKDAGVPVVMTLHNMRLFCPGGTLTLPNGSPCRQYACAGSWRCLLRRCYHRSFWASWLVARFRKAGNRQRLWQEGVDLYTVPSAYVQDLATQGGLPAERIRRLPNMLPDPLPAHRQSQRHSQRVIYVGRISQDKGVQVLLQAWKSVRMTIPEAELVMLGEGPLRERLQAQENPGVEWLGACPSDQVYHEVRRAECLVQPSLCQETFGLTVLEAFALERPAIASRVGALPELVRNNETGILVPPGDPNALAEAIGHLLGNPNIATSMGEAGRRLYERSFRGDDWRERLCDIFSEAQGSAPQEAHE